MTVNVRKGDLLTVDGVDYTVRDVAAWDMPMQSVRSFTRMATKTATVKRSSTSGGKRTAALTLSGVTLSCTPLDPFSGEASTGKTLVNENNTPFIGLQAFATDGTSFAHIILEDVQI